MPSRESELYKDKVEVSLDGRQIFYLFFGGAVVVGMVFVLGVLVGRRVEARGHVERARTHATTDPLAALDRLEGSGGLTFRASLTGKDAPAPVDATIADLEQARARGDKAGQDGKAKVEAKPAAVASEEPGPVTKPDVKAEDKKPEVAKADDAKPEDKKAEVKPEEVKPKFTLQLSSFQDKAEAEAFLTSVKDRGYTARITQAEVEGKGTFYRVRMGRFESLEAATNAKDAFEKNFKKSASVMKL